MLSQKMIRSCLVEMQRLFPQAKGELQWDSPFHLLVAVILSAQATDVSVNKVTPELFIAYPTPESLSVASLEEIEEKIRTIGLYKSKAKHLKEMATKLFNEYDSVVPADKSLLRTFPGVGPKTANVVAGEAFKIPGIAVDTHVNRVSKRLKFIKESASVGEVEEKLMHALPKDEWVKDHHTMIFFGRYHCTAKKPKCVACPLLTLCDFGKNYLLNQK